MPPPQYTDPREQFALEFGVRPAMPALREVGVDRSRPRIVERAIEVVPEGAGDQLAVWREHDEQRRHPALPSVGAGRAGRVAMPASSAYAINAS